MRAQGWPHPGGVGLRARVSLVLNGFKGPLIMIIFIFLNKFVRPDCRLEPVDSGCQIITSLRCDLITRDFGD